MTEDERYEAIKGFHIYNPSKILLYSKQLDDKEVVFIELHPSTDCNHRCVWCRYWGMTEPKNLGKVELDKIFKDYPNLVGVRITGGGEPLMNPLTTDFIKECYKRGIKTGLETNGALFTKETLSIVAKSCSYCRISLDAATDKTYSVVNRSKDFNKVLFNIRKLRELGVKELGVSFLLTNYNVFDIPLLEGLNLPIDYLHFKPLMTGTDEEVRKVGLEKIKELKEKVPYQVKYDRVLEDYYFNRKVKCEITKIIRVIGGDGKVYACCEHAYEPEFEVGVWDGSTDKCIQCRYNPYQEVIDMWRRNIFTKEFL